MKLINFVNDTYKTKTAQQILTDGNTDNIAGLSWKEVNILINEGHNKDFWAMKIAKIFKNINSMTDSVFKAMDRDANGIITENECDIFARENCNTTLDSIRNKTVEEICDLIDNAPKIKKDNKNAE